MAVFTFLIAALVLIGLLRFFLKIVMIVIFISALVIGLTYVNNTDLEVEEQPVSETKEYTV